MKQGKFEQAASALEQVRPVWTAPFRRAASLMAVCVSVSAAVCGAVCTGIGHHRTPLRPHTPCSSRATSRAREGSQGACSTAAVRDDAVSREERQPDAVQPDNWTHEAAACYDSSRKMRVQ